MTRLGAALLAAALGATAACDDAGSAREDAGQARSDEVGTGAIQPIPLEHGQDPRRVALGARLFRDPRLSRDDTISCASCHDLAQGGADGRRVSLGIGGAAGTINAPTVFNSRYSFRQFWDGRAATLEEQVDGPLHAPAEMGSSWDQILAKLRADPTYVRDFHAIYPDGITAPNVRNAIATFERSLITPRSPFDRFVRGERGAMPAEAVRGYGLFTDLGCSSCHQGVAVGGNMYQRFGVMGDYFADRGNLTEADLGRFNVTGDEADRHVFKVPSLRNIALTAPYFHDGSAETLEEAVQVMARYQLGRDIAGRDVAAIVAFLVALTGEHRGRPL